MSSKNSPAGRFYLVTYNVINVILWLLVLIRTIITSRRYGAAHTYDDVGDFAKWTQTIAVLEIVHAAIGLVRAPLVTTFMQVYSRLAIVWGVIDTFPQLATSPAYSIMLIAYGLTEVTRYSYFACNLVGVMPEILHWLRYSTFLVLYPLGIGSEYWLMWHAYEPAKTYGFPMNYFMLFNLLVWPPSAYILITHMLAQRRKVLGGKAKKTQ